MAEVTTTAPTRHGSDGAAPLERNERKSSPARPARVIIGAVGMAVTAWFVCNAFLAFAYYPQWFANSGILVGVLGLVIGIGGSLLFFYFLNLCIEGFPVEVRRGAHPVRLPAAGIQPHRGVPALSDGPDDHLLVRER